MASKGLMYTMGASDRTGPAVRSATAGMHRLAKAQSMVTRSNRGFMRGMSANRRIVQQVGMQVSDLGVQIAGGQSAILSLTQNVPQVIQMFGAWGGILAGVITLLGTFTLVMVKSGVAFNEIASQFGVVTDQMMAFGRAMNSIKEITFNVINLLINNLDQLAITMGFVIGLFIGKGVMAFLRHTHVLRAMTVATKALFAGKVMLSAKIVTQTLLINTLSAAWRTLRGIIASLGIPALIIALGYLGERFVTLKVATGSWGAALALVGDLAKQVFGQLPTLAMAAQLRINAAFAMMAEGAMNSLAGMLDGMKTFGNDMIADFHRIFNAVAELASTVAITVSNFVIDMVNDMVNRFIIGLNRMSIELRKLGIAAPFVLTDQMNPLSRNESNEGTTFGDRLSERNAGVDDNDYMGAMSSGLRNMASQAGELRTKLRQMSDAAFAAAEANIPAWGQIMDLLASVDAQAKKVDIRDWFGKKGDGDDDAEKEIDQFRRQLERLTTNAKQAVGVLGATLSDPVIDMSVNKFIESLNRIENLEPRHYMKALSGLEALRPELKRMAGPLQVEVDKLKDILNSDLEETDKDAFFSQTQEIVTRMQELYRPMKEAMQDIRDIDPRLKEIDFDIFEESMDDALGKTRTTMDRLRQLLSEQFGIPAIILPEIDIEAPKKSITKLKEFIEGLGNTVESEIKQNFKSLILGAESLRDALANVLDAIADKILDFALDSLFDSFKNSGLGQGITNSIGGWLGTLFSFDGGGRTPNGARAGGMDGKGGFLAMLHPNETVIDHTKPGGTMANVAMGYSGGGQAPVNVNMITTNNFNGVTREEVMSDVYQAQADQERRLNKELPNKINRHRFDQGRGMAK